MFDDFTLKTILKVYFIWSHCLCYSWLCLCVVERQLVVLYWDWYVPLWPDREFHPQLHDSHSLIRSVSAFAVRWIDVFSTELVHLEENFIKSNVIKKNISKEIHAPKYSLARRVNALPFCFCFWFGTFAFTLNFPWAIF